MDALQDAVDSLLAAGAGDAARLSELRERLSRGRPVYSSDRAYVEQLARLEGRSFRAPDPAQPTEPAGRVREGRAPADRERSDAQPARSSPAWYLLPVFLWLLGGIIAWACLRGTDPARARKTLVLGAGLSVPAIAVVVAIAALVAYEVDSTFSSDAARVDMTPEQIKEAAVSVPYDSLVADNDQYTGQIIRYEGRIVQVEKHPFADSYVMRVGTADSSLGLPGDYVWSAYEPYTESQKQWLDSLDREGLVMSDNLIRAWGIPDGFQEYDTLLGGKMTIPSVDILILEKIRAPQDA